MKKLVVGIGALMMMCCSAVTSFASENLLTMSFPGAQLGYVLRNIGKLSGVNFSISSSAASEVVTLEFKDMPFKDVLTMIEETAKVKIKEYKPNCYYVKTISEDEEKEGKVSTEEAKKAREMEKRISKGVMKSFTLRYVAASDVKSALTNLFGENNKSVFSISVVGTDSMGGKSSSGSVGQFSDASGKREYATVLVFAVNQNIMDYIEKIIHEMDVPRPMVEVQAVFVELSDNKNKDTGVTWEIAPEPFEFVEQAAGLNAVNDLTETISTFHRGGLGQMYRTSGASASAQLNWQEGTGRGRVLSNPKIRVMSGHVAAFTSETQVPIMNKDSNGEVKTEYKNVGIKLDVLPIVMENDDIFLTVKPRVSNITDTIVMGDTEAPQIAERTAETTVLMRDKETMVIGGLLTDNEIKTMSKVPVLWKIPLLGELFKSESKETEHSSISVYLKLRLVKDYMTDNKNDRIEISDEQAQKILSGDTAKAKREFKERVMSGTADVSEIVTGVLPVEITNAEITPIKTQTEDPKVEPAKETEKSGAVSERTVTEPKSAPVPERSSQPLKLQETNKEPAQEPVPTASEATTPVTKQVRVEDYIN